MFTPQDLVGSAVKLVTLPDVYIRLQALLDDEDASMADVANLIAHDPGLTARLLRMVNSAFFDFAAKIETVSRAVGLLGTQQIHDLALATSVARAFSAMPPGMINMEVFWRNSVYCSVTSRLIASHCNVLDSERLFVAGLLRDIGHLIMYLKVPGPAQQALLRARKEHKPLYRVERELIGCDHAQVGEELMRAWQLPASLQDSLEFHLEPGKAQDFALETSIIHIASVITEAAAAREAPEPQALRIDPVALQITGLSPDRLQSIKHEADQQLEEAISLIFLGMRKAS